MCKPLFAITNTTDVIYSEHLRLQLELLVSFHFSMLFVQRFSVPSAYSMDEPNAYHPKQLDCHYRLLFEYQ